MMSFTFIPAAIRSAGPVLTFPGCDHSSFNLLSQILLSLTPLQTHDHSPSLDIPNSLDINKRCVCPNVCSRLFLPLPQTLTTICLLSTFLHALYFLSAPSLYSQYWLFTTFHSPAYFVLYSDRLSYYSWSPSFSFIQFIHYHFCSLSLHICYTTHARAQLYCLNRDNRPNKNLTWSIIIMGILWQEYICYCANEI